uniref:Uncharacterized protein n=1 Tax=Daphnia galeata TaxID=27404 RepID=A0A8J2S3U7_9CRUS|nr:unnamed protein product [Daphnia galeata]
MAFRKIDLVFVISTTYCVLIIFDLANTGPALFCWAKQDESLTSSSGLSDDLNSLDAVDFLTVRPVVRELRTLRRIRSIGLNHADYAERLTVSIDESSPIVLDLQLNRDLISDNFYVRHHHVNGTEDIWRPDISRHSDDNKTLLPVCHYRGSVRNVSHSWATISTCSGLSGAVFDGLQLYYIEPLNNSLDGYHSWKKHSPELNSLLPRCDEDHHKSFQQLANHSVKVKRQATKSGLKASPVGVHNFELVLVVDYAIYRRNNGDIYKILKRVFDIVNVIKEIYSSLQVSIMLVGVIVWSDGDKIHIGKDASKTLSDFKSYCNAHLDIKFHDSAHLMTGSYSGGPVGRAYVGTLCHAHDSCGIAFDDAESPAAMTASIMSHEMGHNFGMHHDDDRCHCPLGDCVMVAAIGRPTMHWSSCSRELIHTSTRDAKYNCLRNRPSRCGDMVVDPEEECDCGLPNYCRNQCCDPHTCRFSLRNPKVQCADGACCDLMTCQLELPGVECRSAENECDLPEYCFGDSSICPSDFHKYNGIKCQPRKVCVDKKCVADQSGKNNRPIQCPANCTNGGFCNNLGKCHCPNGFNPPFCQHFGMGGSEDGGPSLDPKVRRLFQIELYVIFLGIIPIVGFLFFIFYVFLDDDQKKYLGECIRRARGGDKGFASQLRPVPLLIQSTSVDKSSEDHQQPPTTEKRNFSNWVKNRVRLTLPSINIPIVNGPSISILSPASGCSTATITLSALNTPDESSSSTPVTFLHLPAQSSSAAAAQDKKSLLLTPPLQRVVLRPAPPAPPAPLKMGITNKALEEEEDVAVVNNVKSAKNNKFPLLPPSSAKPALL